jgi:hypothetical protein
MEVGKALGAALAALLVGAAPAGADTTLTISGAGGVHATFSGVPARGCAAAGLCGYSGTIEAAFSGTQSSGGSNGPDVAETDTFDTADARVIRNDASGAGVCDDNTSTDAGVRVSQVGSRLRVALDSGTSEPIAPQAPLGAGACAGPRVIHLPAIAARTISLASARRGQTVAFNGSAPLADGPFSGTVSVAVRVRVRVTSGSSPFGLGGPAPPPPTIVTVGGATRFVDLAVPFRVSAPASTLALAFSGVAAPFCVALDSCGLSGTIGLSTGALSGSMEFDASGPWPKHRPATVAALLAAVRRGAFQLQGYSGAAAHVAVSETAARAASAPCSDAGESDLGALGASQTATTVTVTFGSLLFGTDPLRTRCPGPGVDGGFDGIDGPQSVLSAALPVATLLAGRAVTVAMAPTEGIAGAGYSLATSAPLQLTLTPAGRPHLERVP